jgi:MFS family permease
MFAEYNWPMTVISLAASINLLMYAGAGVFAGWLLDRVAPKWITTVSVLFTTAGFVAASFVTSRWDSTCPMACWSGSVRPEAVLLPVQPRSENGLSKRGASPLG